MRREVSAVVQYGCEYGSFPAAPPSGTPARQRAEALLKLERRFFSDWLGWLCNDWCGAWRVARHASSLHPVLACYLRLASASLTQMTTRHAQPGHAQLTVWRTTHAMRRNHERAKAAFCACMDAVAAEMGREGVSSGLRERGRHRSRGARLAGSAGMCSICSDDEAAASRVLLAVAGPLLPGSEDLPGGHHLRPHGRPWGRGRPDPPSGRGAMQRAAAAEVDRMRRPALPCRPAAAGARAGLAGLLQGLLPAGPRPLARRGPVGVGCGGGRDSRVNVQESRDARALLCRTRQPAPWFDSSAQGLLGLLRVPDAAGSTPWRRGPRTWGRGGAGKGGGVSRLPCDLWAVMC
jgi:hypothetical protein